MFTSLSICLFFLACAAGLLVIDSARFLARRADESFVSACRAVHERDQAVAELETLRLELARVREKRHTHQTVAMLEDLSAVHLDILGELKIYFRRMGALLERLPGGAEAVIYHREFCTYTRARLRTLDAIMKTGRHGPFSYIPPKATRPERPGYVRGE
jgi:hypothetical protein